MSEDSSLESSSSESSSNCFNTFFPSSEISTLSSSAFLLSASSNDLSKTLVPNFKRKITPKIVVIQNEINLSTTVAAALIEVVIPALE